MNLRFSKIFRAILVGGLIFSCCGVTSCLAEGESVTKIGVVIVQTGPLAPIGKGIVNGIILAKERNDPASRVQFIFEDDGLQPARAVSAATKLITQDHVAALITFTGGMSAALAPIAESKQIPLITIAAGDQHTIGKRYVYRHYLSTAGQVDILREEIKRRKLEKVAIVTTTQESLVRLRDIFVKDAALAIVANEEVPPTETDLQTLATKIVHKQPDAIVLYLMPPQLSNFAKTVKALGFKGEFFGGIQVLNYPEVVASNGALIGTIFPTPDMRGAGESFQADYEARFKEPLASDQEVYGYDIAKLLIDASAKGDIQGYLQSLTEMKGLAGIYPRRENNFFEVPVTLKRITSASSVERVVR